MRVIIPFSYYYPEHCAGLFVVDDMMHALAEQGIESIIYVPTPTRNVPADAKWERDEFLCDGKIHIHRFRMYQEGKNPVLRALRYLLCEFYYLHKMLWDKYDVAFIDSTPPIQGLKLPIVRFFRRKPMVYNAQDLFPDTLSGTGLAKQGGVLYKIGLIVAKITFANVDKVIAISNDIKRNLVEEKGVAEKKVEVVYNWVDENAVVPVADEDNPLFDEFSISKDKFRIVYAGNLGNAQNIQVVVEAADRLKDNQDIEFLIFGSGGLEDDIRKEIAVKCLENIRLFPLQPFDRVSYVYSLGNVCLVSCKKGLGGSVMPSKTCSIFSCGRPVLAHFDEGELKYILDYSGAGMFTRVGDVDGFVDAILQLKNDPKQCKEMGEKGRRFVIDNLTKSVGTKKYVETLKSVIIR